MVSTSIPDEVARRMWRDAEVLLACWGDRLRTDEVCREALWCYEQVIEKTAWWMRHLRVWERCAACGTSLRQSCCAAEVATWYDRETFLINLLLGVEMPAVPFYEQHCIFLGEHGCTLKARHYYCVHFLCPDLHHSLTQSEKRSLASIVGEEVYRGSLSIHAGRRVLNGAR